MRINLSKIEGNLQKFTGIFKCYSTKTGWRKKPETTILLTDIKDKNGNVIAQHQWFSLTRTLNEFGFNEDDVIEFCAQIKEYTKGYKGDGDSKFNKPIENDYKLSNPTCVRVVL